MTLRNDNKLISAVLLVLVIVRAGNLNSHLNLMNMSLEDRLGACLDA